MHGGSPSIQRPKDGILKCGAAQFEAMDKREIIACRKRDYRWEVLIADRAAAREKYPNAMIDPATIDEISYPVEFMAQSC